MRKIIAKIPILLLFISIDSSAICLEESKKVKIHIKVESCKLVKFEDYPELIKAEKYLTSENRIDDLKSLKKDYEGIVIYYSGEPYFYKTKEENACEKFLPNSEHVFIQKYPCCDMTPLAANEEPCGLGINVPSIEPANE